MSKRSVLISVVVVAVGSVAWGQELYWMEVHHAEDASIMRSNPDGTNPQEVIHFDTNASTYGGVAVHEGLGKVYWVRRAPGGLFRANLDGTEIEDLTPPNPQNFDSITIDLLNSKLILGQETGGGMIWRTNLDGSDFEGIAVTGGVRGLWLTQAGAPVPAISGIGLGIMLLFIVAVGGFVFKRLKIQEIESC